MEQNEINFYINVLQKKMNDYFTQSIVLESKIQYQNDIISKQNEKIKELGSLNDDLQSQVDGLGKKLTEQKLKPIPLKSAVARSKKKSIESEQKENSNDENKF